MSRFGLPLYAAVIASNILVILQVPGPESAAFLKSYAAASLVAGIGIGLLFGGQRTRSVIALVATGIFVAVALLILSKVGMVAIAYALALLTSDYVVSQSASPRLVLIYRTGLVLSILPLALFQEAVFWPTIYLRIAVAAGACAAAIYVSQRFEPLKLRSAFAYIVQTHVLYFGTLAVIPWLATTEQMKLWYVATQIALSLQLKLMDFRIRGSASVAPSVLGTLAVATAVGLFGLFVATGELRPFIAVGLASVMLYALSERQLT